MSLYFNDIIVQRLEILSYMEKNYGLIPEEFMYRKLFFDDAEPMCAEKELHINEDLWYMLIQLNAEKNGLTVCCCE